MSGIKVTRLSGWGDKLRKWKVFLDGHEIGSIRQGEVFQSDIEPGEHQVWLKVDWASSQPITFSVGPGETARFECRPGRHRLGIFRQNWNTWIDLREAE